MTARIALPSVSRPTNAVRSASENGEVSRTGGEACERSARAGVVSAPVIGWTCCLAIVAANSHTIGETGVRLVGAEDPGLDASREDFPHRGIALRDSFQHRLDRLGDGLSGSLRSGSGPAISSAQSYRARKLAC